MSGRGEGSSPQSADGLGGGHVAGWHSGVVPQRSGVGPQNSQLIAELRVLRL